MKRFIYIIYCLALLSNASISSAAAASSSASAGRLSPLAQTNASWIPSSVYNIERLEAELQEALKKPTQQLVALYSESTQSQERLLDRCLYAHVFAPGFAQKGLLSQSCESTVAQQRELMRVKLSTHIIEEKTKVLDHLLQQKKLTDIPALLARMQECGLPRMRAHLVAHYFVSSVKRADQSNAYSECPDHALNCMQPEDPHVSTYEDKEWPLIVAVKDWIKKYKEDPRRPAALVQAHQRVDRLFALGAPCHEGEYENTLLAAYEEPTVIFPHVVKTALQHNKIHLAVALATHAPGSKSVLDKIGEKNDINTAVLLKEILTPQNAQEDKK